jgi:hypothetical protein
VVVRGSQAEAAHQEIREAMCDADALVKWTPSMSNGVLFSPISTLLAPRSQDSLGRH